MTRSALAAGCLTLQLGCGLTSDPATRLAYCVEEAIAEQPRDGAATQVSCDLEMSGSYLIVLHPEGAVPEEQVVAAGVPQAFLPELRELRLGSNPAIYVIATDPGVSGTGSDRSVRSSRTTYQMNFAQIDELMVLAKTAQPVSVRLGGSPERRTIESIQ